MQASEYSNILADLASVEAELFRQRNVWGEQDHEYLRDEFHKNAYTLLEDYYKSVYDEQSGEPTWDVILLEEVFEALSAATDEERIKELAQVAAVAVSMIGNLRRNNA